MNFRPVLPRWAILLLTALLFALIALATQVANAQDSTPTSTPAESEVELPIIVVSAEILWNITEYPLVNLCSVSPGISNPSTGSLLSCPTGLGESFQSLGGFWIGPEDYSLDEKFSVEVPVNLGHSGNASNPTQCTIQTGLRPENENSWRVVIAVYCVAGTNPTLVELGPAIFGESPRVNATLEPTSTTSPEATAEPNS